MKKYILLFIALITPPLAAHAIIFDLHGVLMYSSKLALLNQINLTTLMRCAMATDIHALEAEFFTFLARIKPLTETYPGWRNGTAQLPQIMQDWLKGTLRSQDILLLIHEHADAYFSDANKKELICAIADTIFNPPVLAHNTHLCTEMVALAQLCKQLGHQVYLLSNLDTQTYVCLQEKFPKFWDLFDGVIISGAVGCLKPDPQIYALALKQWNINPDDTLFIDDICHNVNAADKLGIFGIACKQHSVGFEVLPYTPRIKDMLRIWWDAQYYKKYFGLKKALARLR